MSVTASRSAARGSAAAPPTPDQLAALTAQFEAGTWPFPPEPRSADEAAETIQAGEYRERVRRPPAGTFGGRRIPADQGAKP